VIKDLEVWEKPTGRTFHGAKVAIKKKKLGFKTNGWGRPLKKSLLKKKTRARLAERGIRPSRNKREQREEQVIRLKGAREKKRGSKTISAKWGGTGAVLQTKPQSAIRLKMSGRTSQKKILENVENKTRSSCARGYERRNKEGGAAFGGGAAKKRRKATVGGGHLGPEPNQKASRSPTSRREAGRQNYF